MPKKLRIVLAQLNFCVGDIQGNLSKAIHAAKTARDDLHADVIVFPELTITGYPPEDLLYRKDFITEAATAIDKLKTEVEGIYCLIGHPFSNSTGLHNSCSLIYNGTVVTRYNKISLPNYGVFDELRYFNPGNLPCVIPIQGIPIGIVICEDAWNANVVQQTANQGARIILDLNASPFEVEKHEKRHALLAKRAKDANVPIVYVNTVGQQDEILFDGGSMVVDQEGKICQFAGFYNETLLPVDFEFSTVETRVVKDDFIIPTQTQRIYDGLVLGVRDYLHKNNFKGALIGVSGGIDSALTLAIAVDALGKDQVEAVVLPSRYTSELSITAGLELIKNFDVVSHTISIEPMYQSFLEGLAPIFKDKKVDTTEENIQSRCRGILMMALSNHSGKIVLSTGNRSEMATGYTTLYGDMCGGLAVLKDIPKTMIYELVAYRNSISNLIPQDIIDRPPTAELAPDQKDEDSLPPYAELDKIIDLYINQDQSMEEILTLGFNEEMVRKVIKMIHRNEYKRRQSPIGIRINNKSFGRDRRYPITSKKQP